MIDDDPYYARIGRLMQKTAASSRRNTQGRKKLQRAAGYELGIEYPDVFEVFIIGNQMGRLPVQCRQQVGRVVGIHR